MTIRVLAIAAILLVACSGATAATRTSYAAAEAECIAVERSIVDRTGTTREQDHADLVAARAACDSRLAAIGGAR